MIMRSITINPVLNGYVCQVGCQTVTFTTRSIMLMELDRYLDNPRKVEEEYLKNSINRDLIKNQVAECEARPMPMSDNPTPAPTRPALGGALR